MAAEYLLKLMAFIAPAYPSLSVVLAFLFYFAIIALTGIAVLLSCLRG
ncbi:MULTISPECIES: hypothetical protein [Metallosphaera]|nr:MULTISPECIES: hypothetical protein [Metallosphaera]MCH1772115.1 hypothetical protein [Metallosphaera sedula]MCP6729926.1 hypothetical protein [Metallosphaera sedula]MCY0862900.1 hypothetical protein [Metallosphaera prunae]WPX06799.1 hypothetical protein SOJ17_000519 [Metallosphaera sedula DSM 5348]BBL46600.1 hypothetical protein MJ1HA_0699 [Metallosphaera sedula]